MVMKQSFQALHTTLNIVIYKIFISYPILKIQSSTESWWRVLLD